MLTKDEFIDWLINYVFDCDNNDEEIIAEVICRKLYKAGLIERENINGERYYFYIGVNKPGDSDDNN